MNSRHRILFNTWPAAFLKPGGGEVQILETRQALERLGHEVQLYDLWYPQRDFDILHQFSVEWGVHHVVNGYRRERPVALSTVMWNLPDPKTDGFDYCRNLFLASDLMLTNSNAESDRLSSYFDVSRNKFVKTVNAISKDYETQATSADFRGTFKLPQDFVLSVANIDRRKNTDRLIEACERLKFPLVLIGHIRDPDYFAEFKSKPFVHLGPITDTDLLKSAMQQCRVFALPSICETPGIAALEAASQGAKLAITSEGATGEYFDRFVSYVDPLSVNSIEEGIGREWNRPANSELRDHVLVNFKWRDCAMQTLDAYRECMSLFKARRQD